MEARIALRRGPSLSKKLLGIVYSMVYRRATQRERLLLKLANVILQIVLTTTQ